MWKKWLRREFARRRDLLNRYGPSVNGPLIHANRLAFGWAEGYLCITATPWASAYWRSLHETPRAARRQNVKHYTSSSMMKKIEYSPTSSDGGRSVPSRIGLVSIPYCFRIVLRSSFFAPFFVILSFSLPEAETISEQYVSHAGLIRKRWEKQGRTKGRRISRHVRNIDRQSMADSLWFRCLPNATWQRAWLTFDEWYIDR